MDQALRLLRARCVYCGHLKLHPAEINRYACKLRLLRHGLLQEAQELENVQIKVSGVTSTRTNGAAGNGGPDSDSGSDDEDSLVSRRTEFVKRALRKAGAGRRKANAAVEKIEAVSEERRIVIKSFLSVIVKPLSCGNCKGPSHSYRKDKFNKIFRKPLGKQAKAKAIQGGLKVVNPLLRVLNERKNERKQRRGDREADEGIVADIEDFTSEGEGEDIEMLEVGGAGVEPVTKSSSKSKTTGINDTDLFINAYEVHAALSELFEKEKEIMELVYNSRGSKYSKPVTPDMFFIRDILVPPNRFRPEAKTGEGQIAEAMDNGLYKAILNQCQAMAQIREGHESE